VLVSGRYISALISMLKPAQGPGVRKNAFMHIPVGDSVGLIFACPPWIRAHYVLPTKTSLLRSQSFGVSVSFPRTFAQVPAISLTALVFLFIFVAVAWSSLSLVLILLIYLSFVLRSVAMGAFADYSLAS
jgi:hypothetical protein